MEKCIDKYAHWVLYLSKFHKQTRRREEYAVESFREECICWEHSNKEAAEDHLRVTPIRSGRHRYRQKRLACTVVVYYVLHIM